MSAPVLVINSGSSSIKYQLVDGETLEASTSGLIERIGQMGSCGERVKVLLNRAAAPYPIPLGQIEDALGQKVHLTFPSDYRTVATALNSGVPLTFSDNSDMAEQFKRLTGLILNPAGTQAAPSRRMSIGLPRFASMW